MKKLLITGLLISNYIHINGKYFNGKYSRLDSPSPNNYGSQHYAKKTYIHKNRPSDPKDKNPELHKKIMDCKKHPNKKNNKCNQWHEELNKVCNNSDYVAMRYCQCMMTRYNNRDWCNNWL